MTRSLLRPIVRALVVALLAVAAAPLRAAPQVPGVQTWALTGDAGTTLALVEDHRVPLVEVELFFPAGSWSPWLHDHHGDEAVEILLSDRAAALGRRADELSVTVRVEVQDRSSRLVMRCLKSDLGAALLLLRDILNNRDFDHGELVRRRFSSAPLFSARERDPLFRLQQQGARLLFAQSDPRRREVEAPQKPLTDERRLAGARDTLVRLPGRVIGFAGDLGPAEVMRLSEGLLPRGAPPPGDVRPAFSPLLPAPAESTVRMPKLNQVYLGLLRDSLPCTAADFPALLLANHVLGGHFYSRLYVALRHEGGQTYSPFVESPEGPEPGSYMLVAYTRTATAALTETKLRGVLRDFQAGGITEEERRAAAGYLLGHRAFAKTSPGGILENYLWERERGLPAGFRDGLAERAAALTLSDVNAFIRRYYDPAHFTVLRVVPGR